MSEWERERIEEYEREQGWQDETYLIGDGGGAEEARWMHVNLERCYGCVKGELGFGARRTDRETKHEREEKWIRVYLFLWESDWILFGLV